MRHEVLLETGGHISVADVPAPSCASSTKCPGSGEASNALAEPRPAAAPRRGEVRLRDRADYDTRAASWLAIG
jgi:hypothetical protein